MKYLFLFFCFICFDREIYAQEDPKTLSSVTDNLVSNKSGFLKIEDFNLSRMTFRLSYGETRIRRISSENESNLYYQVISGDYVGSISAKYFPKMLEAFEKLKTQMKNDLKPEADVLVREYIDDNGFELGYIVEGKSLTWFLKQFRNCPRTLFLKDPFTLEASLRQADVKIRELK